MSKLARRYHADSVAGVLGDKGERVAKKATKKTTPTEKKGPKADEPGRFLFRTRLEMLAALKDVAFKNKRSMNNELEVALEEHVRRERSGR